MSATPEILLLGGYDPSLGAGLAADLRAARAANVAALPITTCLAMQTNERFLSLTCIADREIDAQIKSLSEHTFKAIKIGALGALHGWQSRLQLLKEMFSCPIVLDPVLQTTSGGWLCEPTGNMAIDIYFSDIFPSVHLLTPNIPEAKFLLGVEADRHCNEHTLATSLFKKTGKALLLKGGHGANPETLTDIFISHSGLAEITHPRCAGKNLRGTGCFLATTIAAEMAKGLPPFTACQTAAARLLSQRGINNSSI